MSLRKMSSLASAMTAAKTKVQKSGIAPLRHIFYININTTTASRRRHRPAPPRFWLGAQTADTDCEWLKQVKRFTVAVQRFFLAEIKQFHICLISILFQLCGQTRQRQNAECRVTFRAAQRCSILTFLGHPA